MSWKSGVVEQPDLFFEYKIAVQSIWNLAGWVAGTLIGLAGLWLAFSEKRKAERARKLVSWEDIQKASVDIKGKILRDGNAQLFLSLDARSAILAYKIEEIMPSNIPMLVGFCFGKSDIPSSMAFDDFIKIDGNNWVYFLPKAVQQFSSSKVVVFDDFTITGRTFARIVKALEELGFERNRIKTASIACTQTAAKSGEAPDYYWLELNFDEAYLPWGKMSA